MGDKDRTDQGRRIIPLDGLRGLAILLVMIFHFLHVIRAPQAWFGWCRPGWFGVELFLLLSGFLITGILLDSRNRSGYFRSFYSRRMLRIFPLYYGTLLFLLVLMPLVWQPRWRVYQYLCEHQFWYWTQSTNWLIAANGGFRGVECGHLWTLALEAQFYLIWPALVWLLSPRALGWTCVLLGLGSLALRLGLLANGASATVVYVMTFTHLEPLAIGSLLALAVRSEVWTVSLQQAIVKAGIVAGIGAALIGVWRRQLVYWDPRAVGVGITLLSISAAGLLTASYRSAPGSWLYRWTTAAPLRSLAKVSYAVYLFHIPVAAVCKFLIFDRLRLRFGYGPLSVLPYMGAAGLASWAVGQISWHLLEKQFLKLKPWFGAGETVPGSVQRSADSPDRPEALTFNVRIGHGERAVANSPSGN